MREPRPAQQRLARARALPDELGFPARVLARFAKSLGPLAVVDLETTGLDPARGAELLEFGALLIEPGEERVVSCERLFRPQGKIPRAVARLTGLHDALLRGAPPLDAAFRAEMYEALAGRTLIAHNAQFERAFLTRCVDARFEKRKFLDTLDLLALTHPDAPDLRLESFTRSMLQSEEQHRALADALDTARVMAFAGAGAAAGERRFVNARRALERYAPETLWLFLLAGADAEGASETPAARARDGADKKPRTRASATSRARVSEGTGKAARQPARARETAGAREVARAREPASASVRERAPSYARDAGAAGETSDSPPLAPARVFADIGASGEPPTPFDEDVIASVLGDAARGARHFADFRVREEQITLARAFARNFANAEVLLAEGGTGVGKSLAYLAAAIPFAQERAANDERAPVLISTRTKLLQDQLMNQDIPAAARLLGCPELRAVAIKGRANYACARRLRAVLAEGREPAIFAEDRLAYAVLEAAVATRAHGEIGALPAALYRRYPALRSLVRRVVTRRAEQCTREQCARESACPLGRLRRALGEAHIIVANHDLLLRWPGDYPAFEHAVVDEAHELSDVADEVYAIEVRPELVLERFDEIFGRPAAPGRPRGKGLLTGAVRAPVAEVLHWRRTLFADLAALARSLAKTASEYGEVQVSDPQHASLAEAAKLALLCAERIDAVCETASAGAAAGEPGAAAADEKNPALAGALDDLRAAAAGLRRAFAPDEPDSVASFENVVEPFERWRLIVRQVSPADAFHENFMDRLQSCAAVSASLFVAGDAFAAFGDLGLEARAGERLQRAQVKSPFDYATNMRVVLLAGGRDLVGETADALEQMARALGGRTLGLFTSVRRLTEVSDELDTRLRAEGLDVITPRGAGDDPFALVTRFVNGAGVLLGARRFWQGIDVPGDALQAVVIEKLPFEVPTELRKRREEKISARGENAFQRYGLGKMLLNLKQMVGRLIRSEHDRGVVVIVEGRANRPYFRKLSDALPAGVPLQALPEAQLGDPRALLASVGIERAKAPEDPA